MDTLSVADASGDHSSNRSYIPLCDRPANYRSSSRSMSLAILNSNSSGANSPDGIGEFFRNGAPATARTCHPRGLEGRSANGGFSSKFHLFLDQAVVECGWCVRRFRTTNVLQPDCPLVIRAVGARRPPFAESSKSSRADRKGHEAPKSALQHGPTDADFRTQYR